MAADNKTLGKFILDGIPPAPRGVPQVEVTFDIDANGILKVSAKDKATNKEQTITIQGSTGLNKDEVEKLRKEAELHAAEDAKKKEMIEARNMADTLVYTAEKAIRDGGDKVPTDVKTDVEDKIKAVNEVKDKDDKAAIDSATQALSQAMQKIGSAVYGPSTSSGSTDEDRKSVV